jgi:hypothetical protein
MRDERQRVVAAFTVAAFGDDEAKSIPQRALRLLEESVEAYQAAGGPSDMAHALIDRVFLRPAGSLPQELGQVGVTLLAFADAAQLSADTEESREVLRVLHIGPATFSERNAHKNDAGITLVHRIGETP